MKNIIIFIFIVGIGGSTFAQDVHFSQYSNSPLTINPALTGILKKNFRVSMQYKNQWQSISPYRTFALSADGNIKNWKTSRISGGLYVYSDQAGDLKLRTTQALLSVGYHIKIDRHNYFSGGIQGGFGQKGMAGTDQQWGTQYDGFKRDASLPGEATKVDNFIYGDYATGIVWSYGKNSGTLSSYNNVWYKAGVSYHHITQPKLQYVGKEDKLFSKFLFHASANIGIKNTHIALRPSVLFNNQGRHNETSLGFLFAKQLSEGSKYTGLINETILAFGAYYRVNDAIIPTIQIEHISYTMGLSYDINISKLSAASSTLGGLELFVRFISPSSMIIKTRRGSGRRRKF